MNAKAIGVCALAALAVFCIFCAGCTGTAPEHPVPPTTVIPTAAEPASAAAGVVTDATTQFACDFYSQLAADPGNAESNLFFSPFSLASALAITYEGARGTTADEMRSVLHFPDDSATLREGFLDINAGLNAGEASYTLRTANALWAEKTYGFLPGYISTAETWYGAQITNLDFITAPDESRGTINRWVEVQTGDKIRDLLPAGSITPITRLVITNAIYFKGDWVLQFDKNLTQEADFRTASGKTLQVPMMERTDEEARYRYAETDELQLLGMPYEHGNGKQISMVVLLPKGDDLSVIESSLNAEYLAAVQASATSRHVMVWFPKFTLETKYFLPDTLGSMGMPTAFTAAADLSGMDGTRNLFISDVIHQAYVDANEEGTEAAAATGVVVSLSAAPAEPVPVFRADHPFLFFIQDDETGNILFMGRVAAPEGAYDR
ncbi:MAG: proteinase IV [Methanoculleus sp. SDB]|nr:MAG: proteinase IV [Methanoculleus sp. SDB]